MRDSIKRELNAFPPDLPMVGDYKLTLAQEVYEIIGCIKHYNSITSAMAENVNDMFGDVLMQSEPTTSKEPESLLEAVSHARGKLAELNVFLDSINSTIESHLRR